MYDTVYFSCLADKLNIEIISGVDGKIQFERAKNLYMRHEFLMPGALGSAFHMSKKRYIVAPWLCVLKGVRKLWAV